MDRVHPAVVAAICVALKFLAHIHFSLLGCGFCPSGILAAALPRLTIQARRWPSGLRSPLGPPAP
ncbi:MAG: hypothetical protein ACLP01_10360 [Solirubrobacteraceae bacterium]